MFQDAVEIRDRLAGLVDRLDPDAVSASTAGELWAVLDRSERLCAAGKTLLARRLAQTHRPEQAGAGSAAEDLARRSGTSTGAARDLLDTSARLPGQPGVAGALRRGEVSCAGGGHFGCGGGELRGGTPVGGVGPAGVGSGVAGGMRPGAGRGGPGPGGHQPPAASGPAVAPVRRRGGVLEPARVVALSVHDFDRRDCWCSRARMAVSISARQISPIATQRFGVTLAGHPGLGMLSRRIAVRVQFARRRVRVSECP